MVTRDEIRSAFLFATRPVTTEIAPHDCDECAEIREFFAGQTQYDVPAERLRSFAAAPSLFTDVAFVSWLPAFMLAELDNANGSADDFADWIAWMFVPWRDAGERTHLLSRRQAGVVASFLDECARRYPDPRYNADFAAAAARVRERGAGGRGMR